MALFLDHELGEFLPSFHSSFFTPWLLINVIFVLRLRRARACQRRRQQLQHESGSEHRAAALDGQHREIPVRNSLAARVQRQPDHQQTRAHSGALHLLQPTGLQRAIQKVYISNRLTACLQNFFLQTKVKCQLRLISLQSL